MACQIIVKAVLRDRFDSSNCMFAAVLAGLLTVTVFILTMYWRTSTYVESVSSVQAGADVLAKAAI
jgi:hypothetical protein